jgi:hypothetical protein
MIAWHRDWFEQYDPGHIGAALRTMRERTQTTSAADAVPDDWHPFSLRNKPAEADSAQDPPPEIVKHSAVALIDAIVSHRQGGPIEQD